MKTAEVGAIELAEPVPMKELSPEEKTGGQKLWNEWMEKSRSERRSLSENLLLFYWHEGKELETLCANPGHYANHTVQQYAAEQDVSQEAAQAYRRLSRVYTEDQVKEMASRRLTWRDTCHLLSVHDETERDKLQVQLENKELNSRQLEIEVKKINKSIRGKRKAAGLKTDGRGGAKLKNVMRGLITSCAEMERKLDSLKDCHQEFLVMPVSKEKSERGVQLKEVFKAITSLRRKLDVSLKLRDK